MSKQAAQSITCLVTETGKSMAFKNYDVVKKLKDEGKEAHARVVKTGLAADGGSKKNKAIVAVEFEDETGETLTAAWRIDDENKYYVGEDVLIRYYADEDTVYAFPADSDMFEENDSLSRIWNKGLFRTVITVLKIVMRMH